MDEKKLLKYAIDYLSKYDSSKNNLENVLKRKIFRLNIANYEKGKLIKKIENIYNIFLNFNYIFKIFPVLSPI